MKNLKMFATVNVVLTLSLCSSMYGMNQNNIQEPEFIQEMQKPEYVQNIASYRNTVPAYANITTDFLLKVACNKNLEDAIKKEYFTKFHLNFFNENGNSFTHNLISKMKQVPQILDVIDLNHNQLDVDTYEYCINDYKENLEEIQDLYNHIFSQRQNTDSLTDESFNTWKLQALEYFTNEINKIKENRNINITIENNNQQIDNGDKEDVSEDNNGDDLGFGEDSSKEENNNQQNNVAIDLTEDSSEESEDQVIQEESIKLRNNKNIDGILTALRLFSNPQAQTNETKSTRSTRHSNSTTRILPNAYRFAFETIQEARQCFIDKAKKTVEKIKELRLTTQQKTKLKEISNQLTQESLTKAPNYNTIAQSLNKLYTAANKN